MQPGEERDIRFDLDFRRRRLQQPGRAAADRRKRQLRQQPHAPELRLNEQRAQIRTATNAANAASANPRACPSSRTRPRAPTPISPTTPTGSTFKTTVCTAPDQIALAPGYLQREFTDGRPALLRLRDGPADAELLRLSCRRAGRSRRACTERTSSDRGLLRPETPVQRRPHDRVGAEIAGLLRSQLHARTSTSRCGSSSSRATARFAQAFANTIPYSEIDRLHRRPARPGRDRLRVLRHRARNRAPVVGAPGDRRRTCRARPCFSESLSQYSALMVMEKEYGKDKMRKFLKYELDRYLSGPRRRTGRGTAAVPGREPAVHPLPQGLAGVLPPARGNRRSGPEPRAKPVPRRQSLPEAALHHLARNCSPTSAPKPSPNSRP